MTEMALQVPGARMHYSLSAGTNVYPFGKNEIEFLPHTIYAFEL